MEIFLAVLATILLLFLWCDSNTQDKSDKKPDLPEKTAPSGYPSIVHFKVSYVISYSPGENKRFYRQNRTTTMSFAIRDCYFMNGELSMPLMRKKCYDALKSDEFRDPAYKIEILSVRLTGAPKQRHLP